MAIKVNAGEVTRASNVVSVLPSELVVDHALNGRCEQRSEEEIEALSASILEHGQIQPITVRRIDGNRLQPVAGFGRVLAFERINSKQPENPLKISCRVIDCNAEEAFILNLVENNDRTDTTPIDDAHNQRKLREQFGWTDQRIAEFYKRSLSTIVQARRMLQLSKPLQQMVSKGTLTVATALDIVELPETEREAAVTEATDTATGRVSGERVRKKVREVKAINGRGGKGRSIAELRKFFESLTGPVEPEPLKFFAESMLKFIAGTISRDETMEERIRCFVGEEDRAK